MHARMQAPIAGGVPRTATPGSCATRQCASADAGRCTTKTQWPGPAFACDFIFVTEDLADRVRRRSRHVETDASDHQPVLLVLRD